MNRPNTDILLYGMPSTTFLHIKRVVESVIRKANLPVTLHEITHIQEILDAEIQTVPSLKIGDAVYSFSLETESNLLLKKAIGELLQSYNYGDWPCIAMPFTDLSAINKPFLYGHQLASRLKACLELQLVTDKGLTNNKPIEALAKKVQITNEEPMGQILSRPIIGHRMVQGNICSHIVQYVKDNTNRPLIVPNSIWARCEEDISKILPLLSAPLLSVGPNSSYQSKMMAEWWIDPDHVSSQTLLAINNLYNWYDLELTVVAAKNQKKAVLTATANNDFSFRWLNNDETYQNTGNTEDTLLLINSSKLSPKMNQVYSNLKELMDKISRVVLLPETKPAIPLRRIGRKRRAQSRHTAYISS